MAIARALWGYVRATKNYVLQFVLGHRLVAARSPSLTATTISNTTEFQNRLDALLAEYINGVGQVHYEALLRPRGRQQLSDIVQYVALHSPIAQPREFSTRQQQLAFYMNSYNSLVLWAVINNWPLTSVRAAKVWVRSGVPTCVGDAVCRRRAHLFFLASRTPLKHTQG